MENEELKKLNNLNIKDWRRKDVFQFLSSIGFEKESIEIFYEYKVDGKNLMMLMNETEWTIQIMKVFHNFFFFISP